MISLTLQLRRSRDGGVSVSLLKDGQALAPAGSTADLRPNALKKLREEMTGGQTLTTEIPKFATRLGEMLLPPDILAKWLEESQAVPPGERLVTILDADPELQAYPWELARARERLFLRPDRPFIRKAIAAGAWSAKPAWPIDMLVVLGSSKAELQAIDGYTELRRIRDVLRERNRFVHLNVLDLSVLDPEQAAATGRQRVSNALEAIQPQVFHFIGHGTDNGLELFQPAAPGAAAPVGSAPWTVDAIRADLKFTPWLVYLNACRSLGGGQVVPTHFNALAGVFLEKGARAVVAMHADISGPSATVCAERFYRSLGSGDPIDVALTHARVEVDRSIPGSEAGVKEMPEAYLPVLTAASDFDQAIPGLKDCYTPPTNASLTKAIEISTVVKELVNRDTGRRELLGWPLGDAKAIAVHGPPDSGKSWLLAWCMDGWLRREYTVRYRTMTGYRHWFDVLNAILIGDPSRELKCRSLEQALDTFVTEMGGLLASTGGRRKAGTDAPVPLKPVSRRRVDSEIELVWECFGRALDQAAGIVPLVIVLDQFEAAGATAMDPVTFKILFTRWIQPRVIDNNGPVRVVLGLSQELADKYELPRSISRIPLGPFPGDRYVDLLDELLKARYSTEYPGFRALWEIEKASFPLRPRLPADLSRDCTTVYDMLQIKGGR